MKFKILSIFIVFFMASVSAQKKLNAYKYVVVPTQYDFLDEPDKYQLNSLTVFLFEKQGFTVIKEEEGYPQDMLSNGCLSLKSSLKKDSNLFKTMLTLELRNCSGQVVFTSKKGESREKEYDKAYHLALRDAFSSLNGYNYKYEEKEAVAKPIEKKEPVTAVSINEDFGSETPAMLYAQEIENGFQLIDSTPKVIYKLQKTNLKDVFLVENKSAVIYKKGDDWVLEHYEKNVLKQQVLNIKF